MTNYAQVRQDKNGTYYLVFNNSDYSGLFLESLGSPFPSCPMISFFNHEDAIKLDTEARVLRGHDDVLYLVFNNENDAEMFLTKVKATRLVTHCCNGYMNGIEIVEGYFPYGG